MSPTRKPVVELETIDSEAEVLAPAVEEEAPKLTRAQRLAASVRHSANSWWCPNDDFSMPLDMEECPLDGFRRPDFT